jgi:cytochrome c-type biogenesis protein CcmH
MRRALAALAVLALLAGPLAPGLAAAASVDEKTVHDIAAQLRCVVCQSLSVADSPSETANQMRGVIRERLAAGDTPEQVIAYFVDKYGQWILLAPTREGFNILVWAAPFAALAVGLVVVAITLGRWRRRAAAVSAGVAAPDEAMRARIARELGESDR